MNNTAIDTLITILQGHLVGLRALDFSSGKNPYVEGQIDGVETAIRLAQKLQIPLKPSGETRLEHYRKADGGKK